MPTILFIWFGVLVFVGFEDNLPLHPRKSWEVRPAPSGETFPGNGDGPEELKLHTELVINPAPAPRSVYQASAASNQIHLDENPFPTCKFSKFSDIVNARERVQGDT